MPPARFEPTIAADERPKTYALDRRPLGPAILVCDKSNFTSIQNNRLRYCISVIRVMLAQSTIYADLRLKLDAYLNVESLSEYQ
jgi:hypothetical protein